MQKCGICNDTRIKPLYDDLLKCKKCGHVFFSVSLSDEELFKLYEKDYFFGSEYSNYLAEKKALQRSFKLRLKILEKFLEPSRHRRLLDIGCAYGFFLDIAKERFDTAEGIDISEEATRYARKELRLNAVNADFLKYNFDSQKFDVICMWDTVEHMQSPNLYMEKIAALTEKGSLVAITTGNIESLNARIRKRRWRLIHPPTHIHYFSKRTLTKLLGNYGFDVIYNRHCGFYRSLELMSYKTLALNKKWLWLYKILRKSGLSNMNLYLDLYDIMYIIARKH